MTATVTICMCIGHQRLDSLIGTTGNAPVTFAVDDQPIGQLGKPSFMWQSNSCQQLIS
jgi:hypothetical protein